MKLFTDLPGTINKYKERNAQPKYAMHSLELVFTILIFFAIGKFIDSQAGTSPTFTLIFGAIGILGSFASAYYRYMQASKAMDNDKVWEKDKTRMSAPRIEEASDDVIVPQGYGSDD